MWERGGEGGRGLVGGSGEKIVSPDRRIKKSFKIPWKYSMENQKTKLNIYVIVYYENKIYDIIDKQSKQNINPHIDK